MHCSIQRTQILADIKQHTNFAIAAIEQSPSRSSGLRSPEGSKPCSIRLARELSTSLSGPRGVREGVKDQRRQSSCTQGRSIIALVIVSLAKYAQIISAR